MRSPAQRKGHIFNVSSVAGFRGDPGGGIYSTSKFAIEGLSESLAGELAPLGIKVTIVEPGYFRADFLTSGSMQVAVNVLHDYDATAGQVRRLMKRVRRQAGERPSQARAGDCDTRKFRRAPAAIHSRRGRSYLVRRAASEEAGRSRSVAYLVVFPCFRAVSRDQTESS